MTADLDELSRWLKDIADDGGNADAVEVNMTSVIPLLQAMPALISRVRELEAERTYLLTCACGKVCATKAELFDHLLGRTP